MGVMNGHLLIYILTRIGTSAGEPDLRGEAFARGRWRLGYLEGPTPSLTWAASTARAPS